MHIVIRTYCTLQAHIVQTACGSVPASPLLALPTVPVTVHPRGPRPMEAARAWRLHVKERMIINNVRGEVVSMLGARPSVKAVWRLYLMFECFFMICYCCDGFEVPLRSNLKPFAFNIYMDFEGFHIPAMDLKCR